MNQISFTANFITNTTVLKKTNPFKKPEEENVAIVELDINDKNDMIALKDTSNTWMLCGGEFIGDMYDNIFDGYKSPKVTKSHYYAITTQSDNFKKLKPSEILGVAGFNEQTGDTNELEWLEVEPTTKYSSKHRKYKHIGKAFINFFSNKFSDKPYSVFSASNAIGFYKKNKFEIIDEADAEFVSK